MPGAPKKLPVPGDWQNRALRQLVTCQAPTISLHLPLSTSFCASLVPLASFTLRSLFALLFTVVIFSFFSFAHNSESCASSPLHPTSCGPRRSAKRIGARRQEGGFSCFLCMFSQSTHHSRVVLEDGVRWMHSLLPQVSTVFLCALLLLHFVAVRDGALLTTPSYLVAEVHRRHPALLSST